MIAAMVYLLNRFDWHIKPSHERCVLYSFGFSWHAVFKWTVSQCLCMFPWLLYGFIPRSIHFATYVCVHVLFCFFPHSVLQHASYLSELERKHYEMMYLKKWSLSLCVLADASRISPCGKLTKSIVKEGGGFFHSEEHLGGKKFLWNIKLIRFYVFFLIKFDWWLYLGFVFLLFFEFGNA